MTLLSPGGYCKGDVGRTDTGLGEEHPFSSSVIVHDCVGLFFFFFFSSVFYSAGFGCFFIDTQKAGKNILFSFLPSCCSWWMQELHQLYLSCSDHLSLGGTLFLSETLFNSPLCCEGTLKSCSWCHLWVLWEQSPNLERQFSGVISINTLVWRHNITKAMQHL